MQGTVSGFGCLGEPSRLFQGVPTWTWASIVYPRDEDVVDLALTYHGAMLQGGPCILKYC